MFDATIAENIKFGMKNATQAEIEEAAKKANAHNFITAFPEGYNTPVGTAASSQISGGQKQRIAVRFEDSACASMLLASVLTNSSVVSIDCSRPIA